MRGYGGGGSPALLDGTRSVASNLLDHWPGERKAQAIEKEGKKINEKLDILGTSEQPKGTSPNVRRTDQKNRSAILG